MVKDMTEGRPIGLIIRFFIPLVLGNLFQQFYSMVDSVVVGKFVGVNALAGVGATGSLNFMILGFATGVCGGFGIMVGQKFGAKDYSDMRSYIANSLYITAAIAIILTPLTVLLCRKMLVLMQTPAEILEEAYSYLVIIFAGIFTTMLYNVASAILRAIGDSRTPLIALIGASLLNIGLDLLFVIVFNWGTMGVGIATVLSQAISGIVCFIYMFRKYPILRFQKGEKARDRGKINKLLNVGVPMALQFSITAIGSVTLQYAVNGLGAVSVTAMSVGGKINLLFNGILEMIGLSMATYASQNKGAGRLDRIRQGVRSALFLAMGACCITVTVVLLFGCQIALLFLDAEETAILAQVQIFLRANAAFYPMLGILFVLRNTVQGMGYSASTMLAGLSELVGRCIAALVFANLWGFQGVSFANPSAWTLAVLILIGCYIFAMKKARREMADAA